LRWKGLVSVCSVISHRLEGQAGGCDVGENSLFAEFGRVVDEQVNYYVAGRGFEEDTHGWQSPDWGEKLLARREFMKLKMLDVRVHLTSTGAPAVIFQA
jgi:hypothetical protein